jgi:hypothetical protein
MAGRPWTLAEEADLREELANGVKVDEIALSHRRTCGAITSRQRHMAVNFYRVGFSISEICAKCRMTPRAVTTTLQRRGLTEQPVRPSSPLEY